MIEHDALLDEDTFGGVALRRMPALAVPFALVAASAAFFSIFALGVVFSPMRGVSPVLPTLFAVIPGALAGGVIRHWRGLYATFMNPPSRVGRLALVVVLAGASIGAFVGYIAWPDFDAAMITCAIGGAVYSIAFLPAAVLVHRASMRAARARLGSLVAEVDRRTVVATLLVVVAFAALTQAPSLALAQLSELLHRFTQPALSIAVSTACALGIARIRRDDLAARARLEELTREAAWLERSGVIEHEAEAASAMDLGLGRDRWSRTSELATYRAAPRSELVVCGSLDDARRAVDAALVQRRRALAFAVATIAVTTWATAFGWVAR